ncbi:hypothetical protein [Zooshikella ganghwensis]|uniref:hypothetical protein n=1 Tax=Zooshikella ganghwensis TaxID=202772 RepID=UPI00041A6638|nr:hypothetical protein [Zooshikella ganghwensis]
MAEKTIEEIREAVAKVGLGFDVDNPIKLSKRDTQLVIEALESEARCLNRLREAAERYKMK